MSVKHWFTMLPASLLLLWTMYRRVEMIPMWLVVVLLFHTHFLNPLLLALGTVACTFDREAHKAVESVSGHAECEWLSRIQMVASEKNWPGSGAEPLPGDGTEAAVGK